MRRLDRWLLATLLPVVALAIALLVHEGIRNGVWEFRIAVDTVRDGHPVVVRIDDPRSAPDLAPGDRLLRIGDTDLRGATRHGTFARAHAAAAGGATVRVLAERDGRAFETRIERVPDEGWWAPLPLALALMAVTVLILIRAPRWGPARLFLISSSAFGLVAASGSGRLFYAEHIGPVMLTVATPLAYGAATAMLARSAESALPLPAWLRVLPFLSFFAVLFGMVNLRWLPPLVPGVRNVTIQYGLLAFASLSLLAALLRSYLRSDALERRQLKWVLYGIGVSSVVGAFAFLLEVQRVPSAMVLLWLGGIAAPVGYGIAILAYGWLDIDRVISATASLALLGLAVVGAALAGVPRLAVWLHGAIGLDPAVGQWALSLAAVGLALPVHRTLRPWLDRRLFAEQHARMAGFEALLAELASAPSAEELSHLTVARLEALLQPESIASYARQGDLFTPIFVQGPAAPTAFEAESMLVRALEARTTPLAASDEALDAFDRAALTTLGAELVIPIRRVADRLAAFTCLGRKRSGDIYTASERAVLAAVAHKIGDRLAQLDAEELARDTLAMQERLRRYVPGAVADEVSSGRDLEPEEREVTVLFVDLRGYTQFAEGRAVRDVFSTINEHTERVSRAVKQHGGTVVEFNGDGMMAVFGAPEALAGKERAAVQAAREILEGMPDTLQVGIGIATGEAMVGSIRSADRWIWSAIGNTTNLAARLQVLTRDLAVAIAVDEATWRAAGYVCADFERHEGVTIRGRRGRWTVFALPAPRV